MSSESETGSFFGDAQKMGEKLGLADGTLTKIFDADDWAFCAQVYCIIEICVNRILEREIKINWWRESKKESLDRFWPNLPLNGRGGRVRLLAELELMPPHYRAFIEAVSAIRNQYCHDARTLNRTISELVWTDNADERRNRRNRLSGLTVTPEMEEMLDEVFDRNPKITIWMGLMSLLSFAFTIENYRPQTLLGLLTTEALQKEQK